MPYLFFHVRVCTHIGKVVAFCAIAFFFQGCQPSAKPLQPLEELSFCAQAFSNALGEGDLVLVHDSILQQVLPNRLYKKPFDTESEATFAETFAEVSRSFRHPENGTIIISIADYGLDPDALHQFWAEYSQSYQNISPNIFAEKVTVVGGCAEGFAWSWQDARDQSQHVAGLFHHRFYLHIVSVGTGKADISLPFIWKQIPWKNWAALGVTPERFTWVEETH